VYRRSAAVDEPEPALGELAAERLRCVAIDRACTLPEPQKTQIPRSDCLGQDDPEEAALPLLRFELDAAPVRLDRPACDGEA